MNLTNYLRENSPLHKDRESLTLAAIKELGITRKAVTKKLHAIAATSKPLVYGNGNSPCGDDKKPSFKGFSESEIRAKHDTKFILSNVVKKLERGLYIADVDFIKQCDIKSHVGYRQVLDDPEFKKYKGKASGIIYWSHPDSILKMKDEGILT